MHFANDTDGATAVCFMLFLRKSVRVTRSSQDKFIVSRNHGHLKKFKGSDHDSYLELCIEFKKKIRRVAMKFRV